MPTPSSSSAPKRAKPSVSAPVPFDDAPLDNISSKDLLAVWDAYVCAILEGAHAFHGADLGSIKTGAQYAGVLADALIEERQRRAQGHIDQQEAEKQAEQDDKKVGVKPVGKGKK